MSEVFKCPLCGEEPLCPPAINIEELHPKSVECCGVVTFTIELWNQYVAAMELTLALNEMDNLDAKMWKVGFVSEELRNKRITAHHRVCNAMHKRTEVFK